MLTIATRSPVAPAPWGGVGSIGSLARRSVTRAIERLAAAAFGSCCVIRDPEGLDTIFRLRYRIYVQELGKEIPWADHATRRLMDAEDSTGIQFGIRRGRCRMVGCVRLHLGTEMPRRVMEAMQVRNFAHSDGFRCGYVSRLMVERSARGKGASFAMIKKMIEFAAERGCDYGLFHCNSKLVAYYERLGFRRCGNPFEWDHTSEQTPMVFIWGDANHLERVRSPLAKALRCYRLPQARLEQLRTALVR